jgi:hypothetical protein
VALEPSFRPAALPSARLAIQIAFARLFKASPLVRHRVKNAGEIADFIDWQLDRFGTVNIVFNRERLWAEMIKQMRSDTTWHVFEFGVAWGYATHWWLNRVPGHPLASWDGFDRFTGLPRAWRDLPAGAFAASGETPDINDARLQWHVGDVEATLPLIESERLSTGSRVLLFDLDIYEPTAFAWRLIEPHLRAGDLIYFDEAADRDERRVIEELVLPNRRLKYLGCCNLGLALAVLD